MLQLTSVSKSYAAQTVLEDVSFIVNSGEHVGLIGPNGSGKTTLLRIITGQELPDNGSAVVDTHAAIGYLSQGITLDQVREAVRISKEVGVEDVLCSFMFPHPADTVETVRAQKEFMRELSDMGARISMSYTTPYPGTLYYDHADELGIRILSHDWDAFNAKHVNFTTKNLSQEQLASLGREIADELGLAPT